MVTAPAERVLTATGLTKCFKNVTAVDGVDLELNRGECLAVLGPNGAGKTTTVEMLEGLQKPDKGDIHVLGLSLTSARRQVMEKVGVLLQETNLYKRYTVRETLELFASFFRESLEPQEVMERLQLTDKADSRLMHLSGGQKQRVYLGCGLINDPSLLFLDEPTTGLDPQARRMTWDLLERIKEDGRSILLTTHYMDEAETLADRVAIMDHGQIIAAGPPAQLIRETCGEQVLWFSFEDEGNPGIDATLKEKLSWFPETSKMAGGYELITSEVAARTQEIFKVSEELALPVRSLEMRTSTLEDVFLKLTGRSIRDA